VCSVISELEPQYVDQRLATEAQRDPATPASASRPPQAPLHLLLSTLNSYLQAIGGTAKMIVRFADGHEAILDLGQLA
jgi:hypothetical protein